MGKTKKILFGSILAACFYAQAQEKYDRSQGFIAHEWGTFTTLQTSDGRLLTGLHKEEEALPAFAHSLCHCHSFSPSMKGYATTVETPILNVTVKMETPVIYFYNPYPAALKVTTDIRFQNGSISQWYPQRSDGEPIMGPKKIVVNSFSNDFSQPRTGFIVWNSTVTPLSTHIQFSNNPKEETRQWVAPRKTESSFVISEKIFLNRDSATNRVFLDTIAETEKFLFYRGLANFVQPLKVELNTNGAMIITNRDNNKIPFILVYEKTKTGETFVYWTGTLGNSARVLVRIPGENLPDPTRAFQQLEDELVKSGLYRDEAAAMLNTWRESYFERPGLKVFWIVPEAFVKKILPMTVKPTPARIGRVFIGRSEVMTRSFETELLNLRQNEFDSLFKEDRFLFAYQALRKDGNLPPLTTFDTVPAVQSLVDESKCESGFAVFPNPTTGQLYLSVPDSPVGKTSVTIVDATGAVVHKEDYTCGVHVLTINQPASGLFVVNARLANGLYVTRKILKK